MPWGRAHLASSSRALGMALSWSSHISIASSPASASPPCQKEHLVEAPSALGLLGHLAASLPCCCFFSLYGCCIIGHGFSLCISLLLWLRVQFLHTL